MTYVYSAAQNASATPAKKKTGERERESENKRGTDFSTRDARRDVTKHSRRETDGSWGSRGGMKVDFILDCCGFTSFFFLYLYSDDAFFLFVRLFVCLSVVFF